MLNVSKQKAGEAILPTMLAPQFQHAPAVVPGLYVSTPMVLGSQTKASPARPVFTQFPLHTPFSPACIGARECTRVGSLQQGQKEEMVRFLELNKPTAVLVALHIPQQGNLLPPHDSSSKFYQSFVLKNQQPIESGSFRYPSTSSAYPLVTSQQHPGERTYATLQRNYRGAHPSVEETGSRKEDVQLNRLCRGLEPSLKKWHQETNRRLLESRKPEKPHVQRRRKHAGATSRFRGVSWHRRDRRWIARAWIRGKITTVGSFKSEIEAAKAVETRYIKEYGVEDATDISKLLLKGSSTWCVDLAQPKTLDEALSRLEAVQPLSNPTVPLQNESSL